MASSSAPRRCALRLLSLRGLNAWPAGSARLPTVLSFRADYVRVTQSHASPRRATESHARRQLASEAGIIGSVELSEGRIVLRRAFRDGVLSRAGGRRCAD